MANYLRKYPIKFLFFAFGIIILAILIASYVLNNFLATYKTKIEQDLGKYFSQRVSIETINYLPPNFIILKNVSILKNIPPPDDRLVSVEKIRVDFSLRKFISKRSFTITNIYFNKPKANCFELTSFLKKKIEQVIALIKSLSKEQTVNFVIKDASLVLFQKDKLTTYITISTALKIENKCILGFGSIGLERSPSEDVKKVSIRGKAEPLTYSFRSHFTKEGFTIENLEFKRVNFYSKLWGELEKNVLRLYGFSSLGGLFETYRLQKPAFNIIDRIKILLYRPRYPIEVIGRAAFGLNIFNVDCLIKLGLQKIQIENLSFSLNNIPICLKGDILLFDPVSMDLTFSSYPKQPSRIRLENPERFDMKIKGSLKNGKFNGKVELDFLRKKKDKEFLQKVETILKNLTFYFTEEEHLKMYFEEVDFSYMTGSNLYKILLENFNALFNLRNKRFKFVKFNSTIYDGFLEGEGQVDIAQLPIRCVFNIKLRDVIANSLNSLLIYFSKVYGRLTSQIYYRNYPKSSLNGEIIISKGYLDNLEFFRWLAESFDMPSLKKVDFNKLSTSFLVNEEVVKLEKISLESKEVILDGYFSLYENDLVSSKLFLGLSRGLLKTSPKFKSLLKLLNKDVSFLSFDFQLSGLFGAMNFKWLESDFKRNFQDLIPDYIKRGIERNIDEIIESISAKE